MSLHTYRHNGAKPAIWAACGYAGFTGMGELSLFELYRRLLAIVVLTYVAVRIGFFIWHWQLSFESADRGEAIIRRYLVTVLLRVRLRRFWIEALQVLGLWAILCYLLFLHVQT